MKCEIDLEMGIVFKNRALKCYTNFLIFLLIEIMLSSGGLYFSLFSINIISVLNLFSAANKIKMNKFAPSEKLLKKKVGELTHMNVPLSWAFFFFSGCPHPTQVGCINSSMRTYY